MYPEALMWSYVPFYQNCIDKFIMNYFLHIFVTYYRALNSRPRSLKEISTIVLSAVYLECLHAKNREIFRTRYGKIKCLQLCILFSAVAMILSDFL